MKERDIHSWKPVIFDPKDPADKKELDALFSKEDTVLVDIYRNNFRELTALLHPEKYFLSDFEEYFKALWESVPEGKHADEGSWVWYPWKNTLLHTLKEEDFVRVRSSRNLHLITKEEQENFRDARIGIAGLSVGYSIALAIVLEGGGKHLRIADRDTLDLSNLNRIPASIDEIGLEKIVLAARRLYELDPYLNLELYPEGLSRENISRFTSELDVVIDEVDSFEIKQLLRNEARKLSIPLLMATDNEETGMIDVERYDTDPQTVPYAGRIPEIPLDELAQLSKKEAGELIAQFVGETYTTDRMRQSLREMGRTLISWPQIGGTALLNGGMVAHVIRAILAGQELESGRYAVSLPQLFDKKPAK